MYRVALAVGFACALAIGCKQGTGERCEIDSDCEDGLRCVASNTCQPPVTNTPVPDAAVDSPADAAEEASPAETAPDAED